MPGRTEKQTIQRRLRRATNFCVWSLRAHNSQEIHVMSAVPPLPDSVRDWPLWWFSRLAAAADRGDHQTAAKAQSELARLGVQVRYGRPRLGQPSGKRAGTADAMR